MSLSTVLKNAEQKVIGFFHSVSNTSFIVNMETGAIQLQRDASLLASFTRAEWEDIKASVEAGLAALEAKVGGANHSEPVSAAMHTTVKVGAGAPKTFTAKKV